jgi:hypothetical protein
MQSCSAGILGLRLAYFCLTERRSQFVAHDPVRHNSEATKSHRAFCPPFPEYRTSFTGGLAMSIDLETLPEISERAENSRSCVPQCGTRPSLKVAVIAAQLANRPFDLSVIGKLTRSRAVSPTSVVREGPMKRVRCETGYGQGQRH